MKQIGIFIGYAPEQPIKNQGIGRLMNFIINGILERNDTKIVIAAPGWYKEILKDFLADHQIDLTKIELLTTEKTPVILHIRKLFTTVFKKDISSIQSTSLPPSNQQIAPEKPNRFYQFGLRLIFKWLAISSIPLFLLVGSLLFFVGILLTPFIIGVGIINVLLKLTHLKKSHNQSLIKKMREYVNNPLASLKNKPLAQLAYEELRKSEFKKLIALINNRVDIPVWFVPSLFWPEVKAIKTKKVIAAPDIVFVDFPTLFLDYAYTLNFKIIEKTLKVADHFICYSEYVKQKHLVEPFGIDANKVTVIEHGLIELSSYLKKDPQDSKEQHRETALEILNEYQASSLRNHIYLRDCSFKNMKFIFYSSQIRPHKNFLNLIKAYEILLRERHINIKLVVTADFYKNPEVSDYVLSKKLQYDVLALPSIPSKVLAALNHLATCSVNPTLFEGGFPFTFNEAYSVGTPSVMSKIPVVTPSIHEQELHNIMLFDPYDLNDMVNKIEWAVNHRDELYNLQKPLFERFSKRSWKVVAHDYINLLQQFAMNPT